MVRMLSTVQSQVSQPPAPAQKREMIRCLLELSEAAPRKGIEMSVMLRRHCERFTHPAPYEMHYSGAHHAAYLENMDKTLLRLQGTDPDLAAHITVTRAAGIALTGPAPQEMFAPVPAEDYWDSIVSDVENAAEDVLRDGVYCLLNLCRVAAYRRGGCVISKAEGGEWGLKHLPERFHEMLRRALTCYRTAAPFNYDPDMLQEFAGYLLQDILQGGRL